MKAVQRDLSHFSVSENANRFEKDAPYKTFCGISAKTVDCGGVFGYTNSKEAIP